jgi:hypothetical protein
MVTRIDRLACSIGDLQDIVRAVRPADHRALLARKGPRDRPAPLRKRGSSG